jgi:uncharacterized SAM-binding protein YcdF (DUF218 family)
MSGRAGTVPSAAGGGLSKMPAAVAACAETLWRFHNVAVSDPETADIVLGLGSYHLAVADRAADLVMSGLAPGILFCGGEGNWTRGRWASSEAERFRDRALARGIPADALIVETASANIGQNFAAARATLTAMQLSPRRIIVVTKPNTTRRAKLTQAVVWPEIAAEYCAPPLHWMNQAIGDMTIDDVVCEMVGDLQRILIYPRLGFQAEDVVPREVMDCYDALVAAGYDKHLISRV